MACHTRSLPSRHGTLTQRIASACGGPSDAIGLPPVCMRVIPHDRCLSLAERRPWCTSTGGVGWGPRCPQRGRTTSKVRRVWVVNGTAGGRNPTALPGPARVVAILYPAHGVADRTHTPRPCAHLHYQRAGGRVSASSRKRSIRTHESDEANAVPRAVPPRSLLTPTPDA